MENLLQNCATHLQMLCNQIPNRSVGSDGNRMATHYFENKATVLGWHTQISEFEAMDWIDGGASLTAGAESFQVFVSPYSPGCVVGAELMCVSSIAELEQAQSTRKILLLHGEIAKEQLMPKNFVFYNPEEHQRIISQLEKGAPSAIICATGRNASLAGGAYPFPLIEDGDFNISSIYMTEEEGARLLRFSGSTVVLQSNSTRVPGKGSNVVASKGSSSGGRIIVTAHIDAKKGTPGAIDNASGVVVLLLLAELLGNYAGDRLIELVALNGEDYYAVPGQMLYLAQNQERFHEILLNINIDGAGFIEGDSAFSFYDLPSDIEHQAKEIIERFPGITQGPPWVQGDHSIFIQNGCPAMAVSSRWFTDHIDSQDITHTSKDNIDIVSGDKLVEIAQALDLFIRQL
jgi:aminopeptidase YwaD